jgi:hypothetical protein
MSNSKSFFPTIGSVVEGTAKEPANDGTPATDADDEERPVQEIESLCMSCEEQVSLPFCRLLKNAIEWAPVGRHTVAAHVHSLLPRGHHRIFPM